MPDCPECQIPEGAVVLNKLLVVEYLDPEDDAVYKMDLSCDSSGQEMMAGKYFELAQWANLMASGPILADIVGSYLFGEDEDGGEEEISEVTA
jgi:hypothetical protein